MERDPTGGTTGAVKFDAGKSPISRGLLSYFPRALAAVADVSQFGFEKYGQWGGWKAVPDGVARYDDAHGRHALARLGGETHAADSKRLHRAHEAWNALAVLELELLAAEAHIDVV